MFWEELKRGRIGRFPVWAVGVVLAGAVVIFMYIRNKRAAQSNATPAVPDPNASVPAYDPSSQGTDYYGLPSGAIGSYLNNDPTNPAYPVGSASGALPSPITDAQWSRLADDYLVGLGEDPALVENALAKYIQGQSLTSVEQSIVNQAQRAFGAPPEGLISHSVGDGTSTGSSTGSTSTAGYSYVTVQEGNPVNPLIARVNTYQPGFALADLRSLNPGINIASSNANGYISPSNPDTGGSIPTFNVVNPTQIKIPANPGG